MLDASKRHHRCNTPGNSSKVQIGANLTNGHHSDHYEIRNFLLTVLLLVRKFVDKVNNSGGHHY